MKNVRQFDGVYTLPITVVSPGVNNASTPIFFTGYTFLRGKKIKAINYQPRFGTTAVQYIFFTFYNSKGDQLIYNLPAADIINSSSPSNQTRLRLFDLYDIDLQRSYWIYTLNAGWANTVRLYDLNFYL